MRAPMVPAPSTATLWISRFIEGQECETRTWLQKRQEWSTGKVRRAIRVRALRALKPFRLTRRTPQRRSRCWTVVCVSNRGDAGEEASLLIRRDMGCLCVDWKHQFGSHRVVYRIDPQQHVVVVCSVGARKQGDAEDIYRRLEYVVQTRGLADQLAPVLWNLLRSKA